MERVTLREYIGNDPDCPETIRPHLLAALASRGKNKDHLRESAPGYKKPQAYGAWCALMMELASTRVPIGALMFNDADRQVFDECSKYCGPRHHIINACERPMRFNMWAFHHDPDAAQDVLREAVDRWSS